MLVHTTLIPASNTARWYPRAKANGHRRVRRAIRQALRGYPPREFTLVTKAGVQLGAL